MTSLLILCFILLTALLAPDVAHSCGYASCPSSYDKSKLQLHIIAHSHDDVGWLKTADEYYDDEVTHLLTNTMQALKENKQRKFVEVEIYYFKRWWQRQDKPTQDLIRQLVRDGQLTFANGGWSENDEAIAHYNQIIDQMTFGIEFLREQFGECADPKVSWQVDPFGASQEMANLYALMDFDGHFVNRGNQLKGEFLWNASERHSILTSTLHNHYSAPNGFDFEEGDEINDKNKLDKAKELVELGKRWNKDYGEKGHVLITFGDDFKFKHAERYFTNLDRLIEVVNKEHPEVHLFYSSPHCYIKAVKDLAPKLEMRSHDYFPLWSGFFAVRPHIKYMDRLANNLLQTAKQLEVLAALTDAQAYIFEAHNELGVLQHHDAITGTSRPLVILDYKLRLLNAIKASQAVIRKGLGKLSKKSEVPLKDGEEPSIYTTANISSFTEHLTGPSFAALVYNPLAHQLHTHIRIPVSEHNHYRVLDAEGHEVSNVSYVPIAAKVRQMVDHDQNITHELVFTASLPALGYTTFLVSKEPQKLQENSRPVTHKDDKDIILKGKNFALVFDSTSGKLKHLEKGNTEHKLHQTFNYYISKGTSSSWEFCPSSGSLDLSDFSSKLVSAAQYDGFAEVTQQVNEWVWQTIRVYEDKEYAEFDWIVGPVSNQFDVGKDIVTRFDTDFESNGFYYTDSNGRQNLERQRSDEVKDCLRSRNAISYNFYPVASRAILRDTSRDLELTLVTDRSVGAASLQDGQIELMIHRRLFDTHTTDVPVDDIDLDKQGVVARGKVFLFFGTKSESASQYRPMSQYAFMQPVIGFSTVNNITQYRQEHIMQYTGLKSALPENVHLLTLQNWGNVSKNEILVRLENFYSTSDQTNLATTVNLPTLDIFASFKADQVNRSNLVAGARIASDAQVALHPQDIATFVLRAQRNLTTSVCSLSWGKLVNHKLPEHAMVAGHDTPNLNNEPLYICRHKNVDLIPGKYSEHVRCRIGFGGKEIGFDDNETEILTSANAAYQWVPHHGGDAVPDTAFVSGQTSRGTPIYIGRCFLNGVVLGKIDEYFFYAYGDQEHRDCPNHEILTC